jgi:hypothetical protein
MLDIVQFITCLAERGEYSIGGVKSQVAHKRAKLDRSSASRYAVAAPDVHGHIGI